MGCVSVFFRRVPEEPCAGLPALLRDRRQTQFFGSTREFVEELRSAFVVGARLPSASVLADGVLENESDSTSPGLLGDQHIAQLLVADRSMEEGAFESYTCEVSFWRDEDCLRDLDVVCLRKKRCSFRVGFRLSLLKSGIELVLDLQ